MNKTRFSLILLLTILLSSCLSSRSDYQGQRFAPVPSSPVTFQEDSITADCSAFAHLLMGTKAGSSGKDIATALHREAETRGANLILVGLAREVPNETLTENQFDYYGPQEAYPFTKSWLGWKYGFREWNNSGKLVGIGIDTWQESNASFEKTLLLQAIFLRCNASP